MEFIILAFVAGSFPVGWDWPQTIIPKALRFRPHTFASQKRTHTVRQQNMPNSTWIYHMIQKRHPDIYVIQVKVRRKFRYFEHRHAEHSLGTVSTKALAAASESNERARQPPQKGWINRDL